MTPPAPTPVEIEALKTRLEAVRLAITRARTTFFTATIISMMVLAAEWNATLAWVRLFSLPSSAGPPAFAQNPVTKLLQEQLLKTWVDAHFISVPLLGVKLAVSDGIVLGGLAMLITTVWFFLAARRENHAIHGILTDTQKSDTVTMETVHDSIGAHMVFATLSEHDWPLTKLGPSGDSRKLRLLRPFTTMLMFLPAFTVLAMLVADGLSLLLEAPFRDGNTVLWEHIPSRFFGGVGQIIAFELFGLFVLAATTTLCYLINSFQAANVVLLGEYEGHLKDAKKAAGPSQMAMQALPGDRAGGSTVAVLAAPLAPPSAPATASTS